MQLWIESDFICLSVVAGSLWWSLAASVLLLLLYVYMLG
jgi:hypothetical protein